jgi:hypothetical protein
MSSLSWVSPNRTHGPCFWRTLTSASNYIPRIWQVSSQGPIPTSPQLYKVGIITPILYVLTEGKWLVQGHTAWLVSSCVLCQCSYHLLCCLKSICGRQVGCSLIRNKKNCSYLLSLLCARHPSCTLQILANLIYSNYLSRLSCEETHVQSPSTLLKANCLFHRGKPSYKTCETRRGQVRKRKGEGWAREVM